MFSDRFISLLDDLDKFALAEALWRISLSSTLCGIDIISSLTKESIYTRLFHNILNTGQMKHLQDLHGNFDGFGSSLVLIILAFIECASYELSIKEKTLASILSLVFLRQLNNPSLSNDLLTYRSKVCIMWSNQILLRLLSVQNLFIQDISCLALCHLFNLARTIDHQHDGSSESSKHSLHRLIASDVIAIITREKRAVAPVGVSVAGESASSTNDASAASDGDRPAQISELLREALNRSRQSGTAGDGINTDGDALLEAANAMIREIPITAAAPNANNNADTASNRYSTIYTTICKIARKSMDAGLLFAMISLIKRDPNHSCIGNSTALAELYSEYRPTAIEFDHQNITSIIPVIFQHRYDPTTSIRDVMKVLWDQIVLAKHPQAIWTFETAILDHLVHNLSSAQWRDREAACNALEVFLPQRPWQAIRKRMDVLWTAALRLIDDLRESTRAAGMKYAKVLSELILQRCDKSYEIDGVIALDLIRDTIDHFMKLILEKGLFTSSQVSIGFSLGIILRIVDLAGSLLQDWFAELISVLIESMSALEPGSLQYLQFHTSRMQLSGDDLESFRVQLAQQSPMQEALNKCLQYIEEKNLVTVIQSICYHLNRGVGLATRIAAAQSISNVAERYPRILQELAYTAKAFHLIIETLTYSSHLSPAMKRSFINAQGSLAKILPSEVIISELNLLLLQYQALGRDDRQVGPIIAMTIYEIIKRSGDGISFNHSIWQELLSISFIGSCEADDEARATWTSIWNELLTMSGAGTKSIALLRSLTLLIPHILIFLKDNSWKRRVQGLQALSEILTALPAQQVAPNIGLLIEALLKMLPGHSWSGKHHVYSTIAMIMNKCSHRLELSGSYSTSDAVMIMVDPATNLATFVIRMQDLDRNNDMDIADEAQVDSEAIKHGADSQLSEETASSEQVKRSNSWRLLPYPLIELFIKECERSSSRSATNALDKDYPLYCAKAISMIPWSEISLSQPQIFLSLLPTLCQQAYIDLSLDALTSATITSSSVAAAAAMTSSTDAAPKKRAIGQTSSSQKTSSSSSSAAKTLKSASALFGNRYGGSTPSQPSYVKTKSVGHKRSFDAAPSAQAENNSTSSSISSTNQTLAKLAEEERKSSKEPAYRLKFIESISTGWIPTISITTEHVDEYHRISLGMLRWIWSYSNREIWSIRVASFKLLSRIIQSGYPAGVDVEEAVRSTINCIEKAVVSEKKYSRVRAAGLEALEAMIISEQASINLDNEARNIARMGMTDSEPMVIQVATRILSILDKR
jgi:hypothetical protein